MTKYEASFSERDVFVGNAHGGLDACVRLTVANQYHHARASGVMTYALLMLLRRLRLQKQASLRYTANLPRPLPVDIRTATASAARDNLNRPIPCEHTSAASEKDTLTAPGVFLSPRRFSPFSPRLPPSLLFPPVAMATQQPFSGDAAQNV